MNNISSKTTNFILLFVFVHIWLCSQAQYEVEGNVFNQEGKRLDYFNVLLLKTKDSTLIKGGAFESGYFKFCLDKPDPATLTVSYMSRQFKKSIDFNKGKNIRLDSIIINENIALSEVTVISRRPNYRYDKGKIIMDVQSAPVSEAGTAIDVIKRAPGIIIDNSNNISIFGKGEPVVYIDGKEVRSKDELENLQSGNIRKIEIDKNPSTAYEASTTAVINITTKAPANDMINLEVYGRTRFARKVGNTTGFQLNNNISKFSNFLNYQFSANNSKNNFDEYDINQQQSYTVNNINDRLSNRHNKKHLLQASSTFKVDSTKSICFQYSYSHNNSNLDDNTFQSIVNSSTVDNIYRDLADLEKNKTNNNNITVAYDQHFLKKFNLSSIFDYFNFNENNSEVIKETTRGGNQSTSSQINSFGNNSIISWKGDITATILKSDFTFGIKLSEINSDGNTKHYNLLTDSLLIDETAVLKDDIYASYVEWEKSFNKLSVKIGSRYEYCTSKVMLDGTQVLGLNYGKPFPSCLISYKMGDDFQLNFNYLKKISRPSFNDLNPKYLYIDAITYKIGNPLLSPEITDLISLDFSVLNSLSISGQILFNKNEIAPDVALNDPVNPNIVKYTSINISHSKNFIVNAEYEHTGKKYNFNSGIGVNFPSLKIPYLNQQISINDPRIYIDLNNDYVVNNHISCYLNLHYQNKGQVLTTTFGRVVNLSAGVSTKLIKKRLTLNLDINDILNKTDMSWEDKYGNMIYGQVPDYDTRYIKFSVKYTFNNIVPTYKSKTSIDEELERIDNQQ